MSVPEKGEMVRRTDVQGWTSCNVLIRHGVEKAMKNTLVLSLMVTYLDNKRYSCCEEKLVWLKGQMDCCESEGYVQHCRESLSLYYV